MVKHENRKKVLFSNFFMCMYVVDFAYLINTIIFKAKSFLLLSLLSVKAESKDL